MQRFRDGFTRDPADAHAGRAMGSRCRRRRARSDANRADDRRASLRAHGVDFSFTPVLDLDHGASAVIGDRALHRNPNAVAHLAAALCTTGLRAGGMAAVGKHFPGHGHVAADSHTRRCRSTIARSRARSATISCRSARSCSAALEAIMPAHVDLSCRRRGARGYSRVWLQDILRGRLGFDGLDLLRRPRHGGRARRGRHRRAGGRVAGRRLRHGARLQRLRCRGRDLGLGARREPAPRGKRGAWARARAQPTCGIGQISALRHTRGTSVRMRPAAADACASALPRYARRRVPAGGSARRAAATTGPASEIAPSGSACSS